MAIESKSRGRVILQGKSGQSTMGQHWFRYWFGVEHTDHLLNRFRRRVKTLHLWDRITIQFSVFIKGSIFFQISTTDTYGTWVISLSHRPDFYCFCYCSVVHDILIDWTKLPIK